MPLRSSRLIHPKRDTAQALAGQKGVNLIERVALGMHCRWNATSALDVGLDGSIELCDQSSGAALGLILFVQSKVVSGRFLAETERSFESQCEPRDLEYWLRGNAPVVLVVSRPSGSEAYWISVKDYFRDPALRLAARVKFDKRDDIFDEGAYSRLPSVAMPTGSGIYLAPVPKRETLTSNLLEVTGFSERICVGQALVKKADDIWAMFDGVKGAPEQWLLKSDRLIAFNDLTDPIWKTLCDRGAVEDFATEEWSDSQDSDRLREFVWLLNTSLRRKLYPRVRFRKDIGCYLFVQSRDMGPEAAAYQRPDCSSGSRNVFAVRRNEAGDISYCKHGACQMQFRRLGQRWYLELQPTYVYTSDGEKLHWNQSELLAGIKRLERHQAVRGQVFMWADVIRRSGTTEAGPYPHIQFGELARLDIEAGIDDKDWLRRAPADAEDEE